MHERKNVQDTFISSHCWIFTHTEKKKVEEKKQKEPEKVTSIFAF